MRQNAYTFRRPSYNTNSTPVLNKKISLPPAFQEYTPVMTFRNNFSTPAMSGIRGLQTMPGLNITPDVANDAYVSFKFNVPIIADIKEAEIARREVKTMPMTVTISMLNSLPSIQLVAIANQLINLPASNARNSFISVVYKLLKDMVAMPGPPAGDRKVMLTAIDNLETVQPAVLIPPIVILPAGAVGVVVPPGGAPPGGVAPGPGGAPAVPPGPPGAPAVPPGGAPPAGVLTPAQEIDQAIDVLIGNGVFSKPELKDIEDRVNALADPAEQKQYEAKRQDIEDGLQLYNDIKVLDAKGWGDQPVQDIILLISNITNTAMQAFLNGALDGRMNNIGLGPRPGGPAGPPGPGAPAGPPAGGPVELYYTLRQLQDFKANGDPLYDDFLNSLDRKGIYYDTPGKIPGRDINHPDRKSYVDSWTAPANRKKSYKEFRDQLVKRVKDNVVGDPQGVYTNIRGYIHDSMR